MITGRPDYRVLIVTGVLVHAVAVVGQLVSDDLIELLTIELDLDGE